MIQLKLKEKKRTWSFLMQKLLLCPPSPKVICEAINKVCNLWLVRYWMGFKDDMAISLKNLRAFLFICLHSECKIFSLETICLAVESVKIWEKITADLNPTIVFLGRRGCRSGFTSLEYLPGALSSLCAACLWQHLGTGFREGVCGPSLRWVRATQVKTSAALWKIPCSSL